MKRRVICVFSLVLFLLLFCTCLAPSVEREMTLLADVKQVKKNTRTNTNLPVSAGTWEDTEALFQIVEGTGWETGSRVQEIARQYYSGGMGYITLHPGTEYTVILSASRTPKAGDRVEAVQLQDSSGEKLILYFPEDVLYMTPLQNNFTIVKQGEKGVLLQTMSIKMPFFEHRIAESLRERIGTEGMRIYSYTEAEQFLHMLPLVAAVFGLFLLGMFLWGCGCRFSREHAAFGWCNAGLCALLFLPILLVADTIDLPASLMPANSILEFDHYFREFQNIFTVLEQLGDTTLTALRTQTLLLCAGILTAFAVLAAALAVAQHRACQKLQER